MKTINVKQLDEKDEEIAYALISLGIGRNVAKSLGYLQHANEATAVEIEKGMGMPPARSQRCHEAVKGTRLGKRARGKEAGQRQTI